MTRKLVWIRWRDACYINDGWKDAGELDSNGEGVMVESAGFLVKEDKNGIYLATDLDPEKSERSRHHSFIPKGMILKKRVFKVDGK